MRTFLIILLFATLVYYIFKYSGRFLLSKILKNMESKMNGNDNYPRKKEGEVTVQKGTNKNNKTKNIGEYVNFEEID